MVLEARKVQGQNTSRSDVCGMFTLWHVDSHLLVVSSQGQERDHLFVSVWIRDMPLLEAYDEGPAS